MLPVALLFLIRQLQLSQQIFGTVAACAGCLDLFDKTGPGTFFQLVQQLSFRLSIAVT